MCLSKLMKLYKKKSKFYYMRIKPRKNTKYITKIFIYIHVCLTAFLCNPICMFQEHFSEEKI